MKTRLLSLFAAFVAMLLILPMALHAQVTVTTLLSESFTSDESFPPSGWTVDYQIAYDGEYSYPYDGGWYASDGGNGGVGGSYGSAVASTYYTYEPGCYTGFNDGKINMYTPAINTGSLPKTDSLFVDFDLWYAAGYYQIYYNPYGENQVEVLEGTNQLLDLKSPGNCSIYTYSFNTDPDEDPYSGWVHYHVYVPNGGSTTQLTFRVADYGDYCYFGLMECENVAFTNIVVTDVHHPILTVNGPTTINFGTVPVGLSDGPYYTVLSNPNENPITLSNYTFSGANPGDFTVTYTPEENTIPGGGTDSVGITYSPLGPGARLAYLTFNSNALPMSVTDTLFGQGIVPSVSYSATSMFRGVSTELTDTSAPQYLYVNSTGGVALTVQNVSFTGPDARAYFVSHMPPGPIAPGGVDSIGVRFVPDLEGQPDAHMVIKTNTQNNPVDIVNLYGVGILPHLAIDGDITYPLPTTVNFDSVTLGTQSCLDVNLTNPGSDTIAIEKNYFQSADYDFSITPLTGRDTLIAPGGSAQIQVCFTPLQQGHREAVIRILTDIPHTQTDPPQDTSSFIVNIEGTGVPTGKLMLTASTKKDSSEIGTSVCQTDTLWNTGDAAITVTGVTITGTNAADFKATLNTPTPFTLAANTSTTFQLCADPSVTGAETAVLTATGTSSETTVTGILGLGVFGELIADTAVVSQAFLAESCGPDTEIVLVMNTGNRPATYVGSVPTNPNFTLLGSGSNGQTPGGGVDTFKVVFTPTSGPATGSLNIIGGVSPQTIALSATGGAAVITGTGNAPMTSIGNTSAAFTVTVSNNGTCPWTSGATVTVDPQFTCSTGSTTIAPASSAPFSFTYKPTVTGGTTYPVTFPLSTAASSVNVTIATALDDVTAATSNGFSLEQNYPNPFNQTSQFEITLPVACLVHLSIVDVEGQVVQTLLNQHYDAGSFEVSLDASGLASGTYYYQMTAGTVTLTKQMVILK